MDNLPSAAARWSTRRITLVADVVRAEQIAAEWEQHPGWLVLGITATDPIKHSARSSGYPCHVVHVAVPPVAGPPPAISAEEGQDVSEQNQPSERGTSR